MATLVGHADARWAMVALYPHHGGTVDMWLLEVFDAGTSRLAKVEVFPEVACSSDEAIAAAEDELGSHYAIMRDDVPTLDRAAASWRLAPA